jgi:DNA ligase (NAD+)
MTKYEYDKLLEDIIIYDHYYYNLHRKLIDDSEYDKLIEDIKYVEKINSDWINKDKSPNYRVGPYGSNNGTYEHRDRMQSLDKVYDKDHLDRWINRVKRMYPECNFLINVKLDGNAIEASYYKGHLVKLSTRGSHGIKGEDITHLSELFSDLSLELNEDFLSYVKGDYIDIRGEAILNVNMFRKLKEVTDIEYNNARNALSGLLGRKSLLDEMKGSVSFYVHEVYGDIDIKNFDEWQQLIRHKANMIIPMPYYICSDISDIWEKIESITKDRERGIFNCEIDGVVIRVNNFKMYDKLGKTEHHPIGAIAYKFGSLGKKTKVKNISHQVTRTGKLIPIVEVEDTNIGGVTITNITLHNEDVIKALNVRVGDSVYVTRQGDVIPHISYVYMDELNRSGETYVSPKVCPSCGTNLVYIKPYLICNNRNCLAILKENIVWFTSKVAMNIKGIGHSIWEALITANKIKCFKDIFTLESKDFSQLPNMVTYSESTCDKFIAAIKLAWKELTLVKCLVGLGIPQIGLFTAKKIESIYKDSNVLLDAIESNDHHMKVTDLEWSSLKTFFSNDSNKELISYIFNNQPKWGDKNE